jgi:sarcosine oxidase
MRRYEHIVIGAGLIGSAAAKYLAQESSDVLLIGPREPSDYSRADLFASHFDNSRVQRIIGWNATWTRLNIESALHWPVLETQSGIKFHDPSGCLYLAPEQDQYLSGATEVAERFQLSFYPIKNKASLREIAPEMNFDSDVVGLYESAPSGSINPRLLVAAQQKVFASLSGTTVEDVVINVERVETGWNIRTREGESYLGENLLIAAGSFSRFNSLLKRELDIQTKTEVVVNAQLSEDDARKLDHLPSLLYETYQDDFDGIYLVKPQRFADGKWYLKMGLNQKIDIYCERLEELQHWFRGDSHKKYLPVLKRELLKLFPEVNFLSLETKPCVISRTPTSNPYIDMVDEGLFIATGCNGYSAMSSDAQGRIAATLMRARDYEPGYSQRDLAAVFKDLSA